MRIRKLFKFENAHIVRNCSSERCKHSIHGHSYQIELYAKLIRGEHFFNPSVTMQVQPNV